MEGGHVPRLQGQTQGLQDPTPWGGQRWVPVPTSHLYSSQAPQPRVKTP